MGAKAPTKNPRFLSARIFFGGAFAPTCNNVTVVLMSTTLQRKIWTTGRLLYEVQMCLCYCLGTGLGVTGLSVNLQNSDPIADDPGINH